MDIITGIALFLMIWWTVIFCVLPFGVRPSAGDVAGEMPGAPAAPHLKKKAIITTFISIVLWIIIFWITRQTDLLSFRDMASRM
jgi:predicted secreted protein